LSFIAHAVIAIAIVLIGGLVSSKAAGDPEASIAMRFSFAIATLSAQIELFFAALWLRSRSATRFDMTVAAETLVALGVFSLIAGIVLAVIATPSLHVTSSNGTLPDFEPLLIPFAEGLLASAAAPLLATLLRQIEVLKYAPHSEGGSSGDQLSRLKRDADSVATALSQLKIEAEAATKNVKSFAKAAKSIVDSLNDVAGSIKDVKGMVPSSLSFVTREITNAGPGVTAAFDAAAGNIRTSSGRVSDAFETTANNIGTSGGRVSAAFAATSSALGDFTTNVASSTKTTKTMAEEFEKLSKDAQATAGILKRLHQLIESVTNFVRPDKP
jgi:hypothetical protein